MTMFPKARLRGATLLLLLACGVAPALAASPGSSTPTALAPLPGDSDSIAFDITNGGDVLGHSIGATTTGVVWDRHGNTRMLLPLAGDTASFAQSINAGGDVVGYSRSGASPCGFGDTAVKWDRHGVAMTLQPLPGDVEAQAYGINNEGIMVGISLAPPRADCTAASTPVRWDEHGNATALASPVAALPEGKANGANQNGTISGFVNDATGTVFSAVLWDRDGVPTVLPAPPASVTATFGLSNNGVFVGPALDVFFASSALLWDRHGNPPSVLAPLGADPEAYAISVNDNGEVAGVSGAFLFGELLGLFKPPATAVRWDQHGAPTALPPLPGDAFSFAGDLNDYGEAVGYSHDPGTETDTAVVWR